MTPVKRGVLGGERRWGETLKSAVQKVTDGGGDVGVGGQHTRKAGVLAELTN